MSSKKLGPDMDRESRGYEMTDIKVEPIERNPDKSIQDLPLLGDEEEFQIDFIDTKK